jgi:antitoxin component YwqK of YwqJK toxin-antitoxin module
MTLIGYKKCQPIKDHTVTRLIGIFEILNDAKVAPQIDSDYGLYRVNKCKLIGVEDLNGKLVDINILEPVRFILNDSDVVFKLNEETIVTSFDDSQNIIGDGILMFLNKLRALYYLLEYRENGPLIKWRDNGIIYCEENYANQRKNGIWKYYHKNGNIKRECEYKDNHLTNIEKIYDLDGNLKETKNHIINYPEYIYKT